MLALPLSVHCVGDSKRDFITGIEPLSSGLTKERTLATEKVPNLTSKANADTLADLAWSVRFF